MTASCCASMIIPDIWKRANKLKQLTQMVQRESRSCQCCQVVIPLKSRILGLCSLHLWVSVSMISLKIALSWCSLFVYVMVIGTQPACDTLSATLCHLCVTNWETERNNFFLSKQLIVRIKALTKPNRLNRKETCILVCWHSLHLLSLLVWLQQIRCMSGRQN